MGYYLYIIYSFTLDKYYVGYTGDPWLRLEQHNTNEKDKFTGRAEDWVLSAVFKVTSKSEVISIERFIKRQKSRKLIERLVAPDFIAEGKLAQLVRVPHMRD